MNEKLRKLMECHRPGREATEEAEFAALHEAAADDAEVRQALEAVKAWDATISRAMPRVPVPDDLQARLLAELEAGDGHPESVVDPLHDSPKPWWNRWPARVAAGLVTVAALVLVMAQVLTPHDTLSPTQAARTARSWTAQLDEEGWRRDPPPGDEYRQPSLDFHLDSWQYFAALGDPKAVAYRTHVPPAWSRAVLFVVRTDQGRLLPERPPSVPDSTTGNICIGVWKTEDHLCALAVHGTRRTYRRVLKTHAIALLRTHATRQPRGNKLGKVCRLY